MARAGMSQKTLRTTVGMSAPTLSRKLRGDGPFTIDELSVIADALGVPASTLLAAAEAVA